ncbi:diguanylate cyclase [compost metagenome]
MQQRWSFDGQSVAVTISVGVSEFQADDGLKSAINRADRALYHCKDNGRNQVEVCPGSEEAVPAALPVNCP